MAGSGVIIISIPTEKHEKCLLQKKKKVSIAEKGMSPLEKDEYQSMEKIIKLTLQQMDIANTTWTKTEDNNHYQVMFPIECGNKCEDILMILREHDIGKKLNSKISVLPCSIYYHGNSLDENKEFLEDETMLDREHETKNSGWNIFVSSVKSRLTVAQVVENVKAHAAMTFDFIMLLLVSTTLCALGLVENDNICMLSSMLISPMMGPVMAGTFGTVIGDKHLQKIGVRNELIGLGIAMLVGFCYGSTICIFTDRYGTQDWPTYEMYSRGAFRSLWVGALIAILSGAAVALGILSDNIASLVGVAISTSLMPPAVNAGLLWSLSCIYYLKGSDETSRYSSLTHTDLYSKNSTIELFTLGGISICLTFVNIICIYAAGILVFKIPYSNGFCCSCNNNQDNMPLNNPNNLVNIVLPPPEPEIEAQPMEDLTQKITIDYDNPNPFLNSSNYSIRSNVSEFDVSGASDRWIRSEFKQVSGKNNLDQYRSSRRNCKDTRDQSDSFHCMEFSDLWYSVYHISNPQIEFTVSIQIFEKLSTKRGRIIWRDLTGTEPILLGTSRPHFINKKRNIVAEYHGDSKNEREFSLDPNTQLLLIPDTKDKEEDLENYQEVHGGAEEYLVVQESDLDFSGRTCNKAGVGYEAFARQPRKCDLSPNSCLHNQPRDLWKRDHEMDVNGRKGNYFLKNYGALPEDPIRNGQRNGSRNNNNCKTLYMYYTSCFTSVIFVQYPDNFNTVVRSNDRAIITDITSPNFNIRKWSTTRTAGPFTPRPARKCTT